MKNYFKALFLFLLVSSCSPEELAIIGTLTTPVQPVGSGEVAWITQSNSNVVQLVAVPFENYAFKGWLEGNQATPSITNESYFVQRDASNKIVTALFELKDSDEDGVTDDIDTCPGTEFGDEVDANGCADAQKDSDGDGVNDEDDFCPNTYSGYDVDYDGCAPYQKDSDFDGVTDDIDLCPRTPMREEVDDMGCTKVLPDSFMDRTNIDLGDLVVSSRNVTISVWDGGALIDNDIVSVYLNGKLIIDEKSLLGPSNKFSVQVTLSPNGYNYLLLYAHNLGTSPPNTAAVSVFDGISEKTTVLSSNLSENGSINLLVE